MTDGRRRAQLALGSIGLVVAAAAFAHFYSRLVASQYTVVQARTSPDAPVNVNEAEADALERLPGIGPTLAQRILAARHAGGPFDDFSALRTRVEGIGPRHEEALAPLVVFAHSEE